MHAAGSGLLPSGSGRGPNLTSLPSITRGCKGIGRAARAAVILTPVPRRVGNVADPSTYRPKPGSIPTQPGVYRFRDKDGRVVYVGKAMSLRSRLSSYFQDLANLHPRTATMVTTAASVEWTVVAHRGRGAAAGVLLDQGVRPAVQREVPRRQVLPVAGDHHERGVPAGDGRPRRQEEGRQVLRPLQPRLGHPRHRGHAAPGLPDALVQQRGVQAVRADRPALPARLHRQVLRPVRRPGRRRRAPRGSPRTSPTSWAVAPTRSSSASSGRCTPPRRPRTTRRRPGSATTSARCTRRSRSRRSSSATAPTPT